MHANTFLVDYVNSDNTPNTFLVEYVNSDNTPQHLPGGLCQQC